ncbi:hypothetical protein NPX13_g11298 [Xylaria arbuscula]|uniref:Protein kinase domain-containing protein n=1 Tax=Xylaria arbuscula TaxID=114810 RepID=A0A9W8N366_9PEZI|nr:hypothetical protein NPX13_g11298 [Xylaria arbuscula]
MDDYADICIVSSSLVILALPYPIRKFDPRRRNPPPAVPGMAMLPGYNQNINNGLLEEPPAARKQWASKRLVHFDIELSNIFITDTDPQTRTNEHRIVPGLKLSNFSSAKEVKPKKRNEYYTKLRDSGTWGYHSPEQFSIYWNFIAKPDGTEIDHDGPEISEEIVAGNYDAKTNVWGVGLPPVPPQPQRGDLISPTFPTHYAHQILGPQEYEVYDPELRLVVAACLALDPRGRPDPARLLDAAKGYINRRYVGEDDAFITGWVNHYIYDAAGIFG